MRRLVPHAIRTQYVAQSYDTEQFVDIGAADDRQDFNLVVAHAFEREIETVIGVGVRKFEWIEKLAQLFAGRFAGDFLEHEQSNDADDAPFVGHDPASQFAGLHALESRLRGHVGWQDLGRSAQHSNHAALSVSMAHFSGGEMDSILDGKRLVDRLRLQEGRDKEADEVGDHERNDDRVVLCHLEDHEHRRHRGANYSSKESTHTDQRVGSRGGSEGWEKAMGDCADRSAEHGADE